MDGIEVLQHDHRMVEQLFRDYHAAASDAQRRGVVEIMIRELSKHAALEETLVYPLAARVLADGGDLVRQRLDTHRLVKDALLALDRASAGDPDTDELMATLREHATRHVEQDEGQLLPGLREALDQQALDELGRALDDGKHTAPTRPHPHAPDTPPALTLAAPVASIYDRLRDRMDRRPRT